MLRAVLMLLAANLLGGLTYPWQKMALRGLPPGTLALLRTVAGLACMAAWLAWRGNLRWRWDRRETARLAAVGILAFAAPQLLGILGVGLSTSADASLLILLEPVGILLFSRWLLGEPVGGRRSVGVGLGMAGALLVVTEGAGGPLLSSGHFRGNLLLAASGLLWGLWTPLMSPLAKRHGAVENTFGSTVFALLLFLPAAPLEGTDWISGPDAAPSLGYAVLLGVMATFLSTVLWAASLARLPSPVVAPFVLLQPAVGALAGVWLLDETLPPRTLAGAGLAAAG
ncbi:MAG: DMT family transporter, partial [Planctomycetaceae bacterium]|nr:DMT family transporter [Planctomycetaceae bacterium]